MKDEFLIIVGFTLFLKVAREIFRSLFRTMETVHDIHLFIFLVFKNSIFPHTNSNLRYQKLNLPKLYRRQFVRLFINDDKRIFMKIITVL